MSQMSHKSHKSEINIARSVKLFLFFFFVQMSCLPRQNPAFWEDMQAFKKQDSILASTRMLFFLLVVLLSLNGQTYKIIFPDTILLTGVLEVHHCLI